MHIPVNRVVTFIGPLIAFVSAAAAAWLVGVVNVLGIPGLDQANIATYIASAVTALIVAGLHALGGWAWLRGHHIIMESSAFREPMVGPPGPTGPMGPMGPPASSGGTIVNPRVPDSYEPPNITPGGSQ